MSLKMAKDQGNMPYQELLDKNHALEAEVQDLKIRLQEAEELGRAINEGDLDALIIPGPQGKLVFTLESADHAYRVLVETMNEGTATIACDGTILYCNRRFAELIRMPPQAIVGKSIYGFIESEDTHMFNALLMQKTNAGEIKLRAKSGVPVPVYLSISSLQSKRSQDAWCLVVTDLTEQKKNEEIVSAGRLAQSIIEQAAEAIVVCDTKGKITHFSNAVSRICKCDPSYRKLEDVIDLRFSEGAKIGKTVLPVSSALGGFSILGVETTFELKDGKKFHLLLNSVPLKNSDSRIIGCVVTLTDITEQKRVETLRKAINSVNQVIHSTFDFDEIMKKAISEASRAIGCETAAISFREGRRWVTRYVHGFPEDVIGTETNDGEEPHAVLAIKTKKPVSINDAFNDERVNIDHMKKWGVRSVLVIPLIFRSKVIAVLFLNYHSSTFTFDNRHLDFAVQLASSMSLALENSRLFESLKLELAERKQAEKALHESEKRFKLLSEANSILLLSKEPENMIQNIAGKLMHHLNCDVFFNYVFDKTRGRLHLNAYGGISKEAAKEIEWLEKGSAICGCVARDGYRIVSMDVQHNEDKRADLVRAMGIQAYACQPLHVRDKTIGTLSFGTKSRKDFKDDELALMSTVADQVSVAIERKRAEDKLKETLDNLENLVKERTAELEKAYSSLEESEERYRSFIENFQGIAFQADENFIPVFMHGTVEEITGYREEEFISRQPWKEIIHPEDLPSIHAEEERVRNSQNKDYGEIDFRIICRDGKIKWMHEIYQKIPGRDGTPDSYQGAIYDITERKEAEEALAKMDRVRIKEIHHRIKNNLQVICSLLSLEAERFCDEKILEALKESQNRVTSMALIHEELYKGDKSEALDFSAYLRKLTAELFSSYSIGNDNISLKMDLEQAYLDIDTAIPLGIIVNELVSNSLKHAFPAEGEGEIHISLHRTETPVPKDDTSRDQTCSERGNFQYLLKVSDNGKGIPEEIEFENVESLGLQLVNILVEQIDGCTELKREGGTEFAIYFDNKEQ